MKKSLNIFELYDNFKKLLLVKIIKSLPADSKCRFIFDSVKLLNKLNPLENRNYSSQNETQNLERDGLQKDVKAKLPINLDSGYFKIEHMKYLIEWMETDKYMLKIFPEIYKTMGENDNLSEKLKYYFKFNALISKFWKVDDTEGCKEFINFLNDFKTRKHLLELELSHTVFEDDVAEIQRKILQLDRDEYSLKN